MLSFCCLLGVHYLSKHYSRSCWEKEIICLRPWNVENKLSKLYKYCIAELCPVRAVNIFERSCHQIHGVYLAGGYRHMTKGLMSRFQPVGWQPLATHRLTLDWAYLCAHDAPWKAVLSRGKGWLNARWRPTRVPNGTTDCGDISAKSFFRNVWPWGISHREQVVYGSRKQCGTWGWWHFFFPSGLVVKGDMECGEMRSTLHISRNLSTRNFSEFRSVPHYMCVF